MAADELRIWALGEERDVEAVPSVAGVNLEDILEETLVRRPEMLEAGLHLVGRQTPTEGGPLDLLGVDAGGRLVVYELKREKLTREAVTQCIDYAAALSARTPAQIGELISDHSGQRGVGKIEDFEAWYQEWFAENELSDLLPPRLVLVGLGVDERAEQMARFLHDGGIDISVLTFFGFHLEGRTLLARQIEIEREGTAAAGRRTIGQSAAERRLALESRLTEKGLEVLFGEVASKLRAALPESTQRAGSWGISFSLASGGGRRRFCHLWVAEVGVRLEWFPHPESYDVAALGTLRSEAERCGWRPTNLGYALDIPDEATWNGCREGVDQFIVTARESWNPMPTDSVESFRERVWSYLQAVPSGKVVTYGQVARALGVPVAAQAVGGALRVLPDETDVPWHRVVSVGGELNATENREQRRRLEDEGVSFGGDDLVDLEEHQWRE
ncbi:MAG: DUF91 domain-containing protein [Gammaproteobacteria bacterium]|nr:DUF91 domain-containing protein [Gammaproteobacteria bacterium]